MFFAIHVWERKVISWWWSRRPRRRKNFWSRNALTFRKSTAVVRSLEALSFLSLFHAHGMIVPTLFPFSDIILLELRKYLLDAFSVLLVFLLISHKCPKYLLLLILLFPYYFFFFLPFSFILSFQNYDIFYLSEMGIEIINT